MKAIFTCLALLIAFTQLQSQQPWAPLGATWHYRQGAGFGEPIGQGYYRNTVVGDTLIQGQNCRKINRMKRIWTGVNVPIEPVFTYMKNDSVYFYDPTVDRFALTYDFSASEGDTLRFSAPNWNTFPPETDTFFRVRVDSIRFRQAGQDQLRFFYVTNVDEQFAWWFYGGWYAEKIGGRMFQTPFPSLTFPEIDGFFRCYADSTAFIQLSFEDCEYPFSSDVNTPENTLEVSLSPNPAQDWLLIQCPEPARYTIFTQDGRATANGRIHPTDGRISVRRLPQGCYTVLIQSDLPSKKANVLRFVKGF